MRSKTGRRGRRMWVLGLALWLAAGPATGGPPQCRIAPAADARLRLEVWGRELAGARGAAVAHSARRVAWVADRQGTVIEALFLVTLQAAGAPGQRSGPAPRPPAVGALHAVGNRFMALKRNPRPGCGEQQGRIDR